MNRTASTSIVVPVTCCIYMSRGNKKSDFIVCVFDFVRFPKYRN